jgi:hypothetical protein
MASYTEPVNPEMASRLNENRDGRLTSNQWLSIVTEPVVLLILLCLPIILIAGPRLFLLGMRGGRTLSVLLIMLPIVIIPLLFRAWRYARVPVHHAILYSDASQPSRWLFWRPPVLYHADGSPMHFRKRLAPYTPLEPNQDYIVYYMHDGDRPVLLSLAPASHRYAERWQPSTTFHTRLKTRQEN